MSESPSNHLIRSLTPKNILSFGPDTPEIELRPLNVIIGTNGSGKSNLIEVINLMRVAPKDWSEVTRTGGGISNWRWKGATIQSSSIEWILQNSKSNTISHHIAFSEVFQSFYLDDEIISSKVRSDSTTLYYYADDFGIKAPHVLSKQSGAGRKMEPISLEVPDRSILGQLFNPPGYPELAWLTSRYQKIRLYREWSFGRNTTFRLPQQADMKRDTLEEDFSNLGLFLNRLKTEFPAAKRAFLKALQSLYDGITDFEVNTSGGTVQVFLHEGDFAIPATRLSDGTLRYICLLAILCDPQPPPLICIEEPELGLHPDILPGLADLLRTASERTQIIITTHSDILVDAMTETPECVLVCEKHEGKTEMKRLASSDLSVWLEKYRLGQLWIDGQLGGKRW